MGLQQRLRWAAVGTAVLVAVSPGAGAAPVIKQMIPASGPGGHFVVAVVSDHYSDETAFEADAFRLVDSALFNNPTLNDTFYRDHKAAFTFMTVFDSWPSTDPTRPPLSTQSNFGFVDGSGVTDCDIYWQDNTSAALENIAAGVNPQVILVVAKSTFDVGCSSQNWTYVTSHLSSRDTTVAHEFGHLVAGLYDEYVRNRGDDPDAPIDELNCSTSSAPYWIPKFAGSGSRSGCDTWSDHIAHPYDSCLMNVHTAFCSVCAYHMGRALQPPPKAPTNLRIVGASLFGQPVIAPQDRSVRVLIRVNRRTNIATVETANDVTAAATVSYSRFGDYGFEITQQGTTLATGAIRGNPFRTRSFRGRPPHEQSDSDIGVVTVSIPAATKAALRNRPVDITIYKLEPASGQADLTPQELARLKSLGLVRTVARVTAADLQKAME